MKAAALVGVVAAAGLAAGGATAAFTATTSNTGNTFAAAPDLVAPSASALAIGKTEGGEPGYLRRGGTFRAYANVADTGNPASGVASVTGDIGGTSFALAAGSPVFGDQTFTHSSATQTAPASLAEGSRTFTVGMTDNAGNSATQTQSFTVDNTAPSGADIQTKNNGVLAGLPEEGDTITYSFSEPIDRQSVIAGWTAAGDPQNVTVRIAYALASGYDTLTVYDASNTTQLGALGSVRLTNGLLAVAGNVSFGVSAGGVGRPSKLVRTGNDMTITLGTPTLPSLSRGTVAMQWSPSAAAFDRAGNPASTATVTESGTADPEF